MSTRDYLRSKFYRRIESEPAKFGTRDGRGSGAPEPRPERSVAARPTGERSPTQLETVRAPEPPAEIIDPLKPAIYPRQKRGLLWRILRLFVRKPKPAYKRHEPMAAAETTPEPATQVPPPLPGPARRMLARLLPGRRILTPEEELMAREAERRKAIENQLRAEADLFKGRILNVLDRRNICYRYAKSERDQHLSGMAAVKFHVCKIYPEAFYFFVDVPRLPRGVSVLDLVQTDLLTDLSIACGHRVSAHYSEASGCCYIVERSTGVLGIPNHVKLSDMWDATPAYADGLSIPFGLTTNSKPIYRSLSQMYSMLIAGTIGAGKSNFANVLLCTLIRRNPPDRLKLLLVDLKGGLEFSFYEGVPHLLSIPEHAPNGICYERTQVPGVLEWLLNEGERRIQIIKAAGYKDIGRYNHHNRKKALPHLVLVCDEWADIKLEPRLGKQAEDLLTNICARFRAVGIHVIVCTQTPKVEVISTRIKGVLPAKVAFSVPTNPSSIVILDNTHAKGLEPSGRCLLQWNDERQIQTPFISDADIKATVEGAIAGHFEKSAAKSHDVTELEIMGWALEHDSGWLATARLFKVFSPRGITQREVIDLVASWEGREFVIGTSAFRVDPPAGSRARRLVAIDTMQESEAKNVG